MQQAGEQKTGQDEEDDDSDATTSEAGGGHRRVRAGGPGQGGAVLRPPGVPVADPRFPAYDDEVPSPGPDAALAERFADLRRRRGALAAPPDLSLVRDVVVVVSSSRGGSSHLATLLRRCPGLVTLPAEVNPLVVVAQLGGRSERGAVLAEELALQLGAPTERPDPAMVALDAEWRLATQWPAMATDHADVADAVRAGLAAGGANPEGVTRGLLEHLRRRGLPIDPFRYDLPGSPPAPPDPPDQPVVEMAPFVPVPLWRRATREELQRLPVVLVTPRLSWRLPAIRALFPNACVRVLHLTRNPGAAVNGLVDAWLAPGFFTMPLGAPDEAPLAIRGYTDRFPDWGGRWWKLDLPPTWQELTDRPLVEVATAQWREAHTAVLADADSTGADVHRVHHEDLVGTPEHADRAARDLAGWLGVDGDALAGVVRAGVPPVMATAPPGPGRWRRRTAELAPVLDDPAVRELAARLDYSRDPEEWA